MARRLLENEAVLQPEHRILRAWLISPTTGVIELDADWSEDLLPILQPGDNAFALASLEPAPPELYGAAAAYFVDGDGKLVFVLNPADHSWIDFDRTPVYVAGDFNDWRLVAHERLHRCAGLKEVFVTAFGRAARTFPARWPLLRLDRIYARNARSLSPLRLPSRPTTVVARKSEL